jgi:hypothetical protein
MARSPTHLAGKVGNQDLHERLLCNVVHTLSLSQFQEGMDAFDQFKRAADRCFLESAIEWLAGERVEV